MSDQTANPVPSSPRPALEGRAREFLQLWAQSLSHVLQQISGNALPVECLTEPLAVAEPRGESDLYFVVVAAGGLRGEMSLRLSPPVAMSLAQLFMSENQDPAAALGADQREAVQELLRQVAGQAATALVPLFGEVQLRLEAAPAPSWSPGAIGWLASAAAGAACRVEIEWQLSAALHAALLASPPAAAASSEPATQSPPGAASSLPVASANNLGILMDVQLDVVLRFGERKMLLREILELGAGSVVELDRKVDEPVDLLLDGRLVARGEVVVVDGNYGLRVLELAAASA